MSWDDGDAYERDDPKHPDFVDHLLERLFIDADDKR